MVIEFLNKPDRDTILFIINSNGALTPMLDFPENYKSKMFYFIKLEPSEVTPQNCSSILMYGEISANPLEDFKAVTENVSYCTVT